MTDRGSGGRDRPPRDDRDLAGLVEELSATLESLQDAVDAGSGRERIVRGPPRPRDRSDTPGPALPAPPTPRELIRFTEQYTIPTLISVLESGVRSLELLRATLRLLDGRGIESASPETRDRVESVGRTTLDRVDAVLSDFGSVVEGGEPSDPDARDLLADARALREEIDRRLREVEAGDPERDDGRDWDGGTGRASGRTPARGREIPVRSADEDDQGDGTNQRDATDESEGKGDGDDDDVPVDVDAELETIRRDVRGEEREHETPDTAPEERGTEEPNEDEGEPRDDGR